MTMTMNGDIWDSFWDSSTDLGDDDAIECHPMTECHSMAEMGRVKDEFGIKLLALLDEVFPVGKVMPRPPAPGPLIIGKQINQQFVGFAGTLTKDGSQRVWEGFWRMSIAPPARQGYRNRSTRPMGARNVVSERGAAAWLSGTHFQIMKLSCELIKEAIHPDNFLPDPIRAFAAAYDLLGIGVTASEAAALVAQGLPWVQRGTNLRHAVRVLRKQGNSAEVVPVGTIALAFKDTWRYGIGIRMGGIPGKVSGLKKSHKAPVTVLPYRTALL